MVITGKMTETASISVSPVTSQLSASNWSAAGNSRNLTAISAVLCQDQAALKEIRNGCYCVCFILLP